MCIYYKEQYGDLIKVTICCKSILSNYDFDKVKVAASNAIENLISKKK